MNKATILIVDDEFTQRQILTGYLKQKGYIVLESSNGKEGIETVSSNPVDIILTDYKMPDITGIELLKQVRNINPEITVVVATAYGTIEHAVLAMKEGAYDYLTKPIDLEELDLMLKRILERKNLIAENRNLREQLGDKYKLKGIIARSKKMEDVLSIASRVADSKASVLITGESGTGKELVAKAIHFAGSRKEKSFVPVNCAALNENLIESELFGHEKGAFTGADKQRTGRFETADGGTIFLDEIGDLPKSTQVKLLRVLQEGIFERVGSSKSIEVDVRVISATNKNLNQLIKTDEFREDLFYRLNVVSIEIPPLRERRDDIVPLINFYLKNYCDETGKIKTEISRDALDRLIKYNYPGNVRELENIMHRAVVLSRNALITVEDISLNINEQTYEIPAGSDLILKNQVEQLERKLIIKALEDSNNNQSLAAKNLGLTESNLRYRLNKLGLK